MFQEYHSCPAGITSSRACDFYGMLPGNVLQQSDADMAYCQTTFRGTPTYVRLPKHRWPADWHGKYWDPVCPLEKALYGHPESGYYWEEHCDEKLRLEGFQPIDEWPGTYYHPKHKAFLVVYVDDFKLAAPAHLPGSKRDNIADVWALIQKHVEMDPPTGPGTFPGCKHILTNVPCEGAPGGQVCL